MIKRLLTIPEHQSVLVFGARGTGKSTLLNQQFAQVNTLYVNLLDPEVEGQFVRQPEQLAAIVRALPSHYKHVVLDEIQKIPKLLDVVHLLIEEKIPQKFVMTGSSARKLRHGGANLLAGRAIVYSLFPFSFLELGKQFDLPRALAYGMLPKLLECKTDLDCRQFLNTYAHTYLKEEIWAEQLLKKLDPFRHFLEIAAQSNGKIINFSNIARDVGVSDKTIHEYYSILEDTLLGFFLNGFQHSFRKRLKTKPKFYYFDVGVSRALSRSLTIPLQEGTSSFGETFEHFVILECMKLASYYQLDYRFSYLTTKEGTEIDLVVDRPGKPYLLLEIKSSKDVRAEQVSTLDRIAKDLKNSEAVCFSQDQFKKQYHNVTVYPWHEGIKAYFIPN